MMIDIRKVDVMIFKTIVNIIKGMSHSMATYQIYILIDKKYILLPKPWNLL